MSIQQDMTSVCVITPQLCYRGQMATRGYRVADVLIDGRTDQLELRDVTARTLGPDPSEIRFDAISLRKDRILMVVLTGKHEAPIRRGNNYVEKVRYGAIATLPGYILSGILHLSPHATASTLLCDSATVDSFLGVTEVQVHSAVHPVVPPDAKVVVIRRRCIEAVQLSADPLPKRKSALLVQNSTSS